MALQMGNWRYESCKWSYIHLQLVFWAHLEERSVIWSENFRFDYQVPSFELKLFQKKSGSQRESLVAIPNSRGIRISVGASLEKSISKAVNASWHQSNRRSLLQWMALKKPVGFSTKHPLWKMFTVASLFFLPFSYSDFFLREHV